MGAYTSIAADCVFVLGGEHRMTSVTTFPMRIRLDLPGKGSDGQPASKGDVRIGSDVWIGARTTVLSGSEIGDGAIVGAGSLVAGEIPPYAIAVGSPARVVRYRFPDRVVASLLRIRWWDWSDNKVIQSVDELSSDDVEAFCRAHDPEF